MTVFSSLEHRTTFLRRVADSGFAAAATDSGCDPLATLQLRETDAAFDADVSRAEELLRLRLEGVLVALATNPTTPLKDRVSIAKQLVKRPARRTPGKTPRCTKPDVEAEPAAAAEPAADEVRVASDTEPVIRPIRRTTSRIGRNKPCDCGSGRKSKRCCHAAGNRPLNEPPAFAGRNAERASGVSPRVRASTVRRAVGQHATGPAMSRTAPPAG